MKFYFPLLGVLIILSACRGGGDVLNSPSTKKAVFTNQDRNGACWDTSDCMTGLRCEGASQEVPGVCSLSCTEHSDCGNGFLCREGACQKDCAEVQEKCSDRRACCYFDENGDGVNDSSCDRDENDDQRCLLKLHDDVQEEVGSNSVLKSSDLDASKEDIPQE